MDSAHPQLQRYYSVITGPSNILLQIVNRVAGKMVEMRRKFTAKVFKKMKMKHPIIYSPPGRINNLPGLPRRTMCSVQTYKANVKKVEAFTKQDRPNEHPYSVQKYLKTGFSKVS